MPDANSTGPVRPSKPDKPSADFPLYPHPSGSWAKTINGQKKYFGPWSDPAAALARYLGEKDNLENGLPRDHGEPLTDGTLFDLTYKFLEFKKAQRDGGELADQTYRDYARTAASLTKTLGRKRPVDSLRPVDFTKLRACLAKQYGPVRLANEVTRVKVIFNYGTDEGLIERPVTFGKGFKRPRKETLRKHRAARGAKRFEPDEIRRMMKAADTRLRAMILLGVNAALGNNDVALLTMQAMDLRGGWLTYPRPKNGRPRRAALWPETVKALRQWLKVRPEPSDTADASIVFTTTIRGAGVRDTSDVISKATRKLLAALDIPGNRGFYGLRHSFRGAADSTLDMPAIRLVMGHGDASIDDVYRGAISDERLLAVAGCVRTWLALPGAGKGARS